MSKRVTEWRELSNVVSQFNFVLCMLKLTSKETYTALAWPMDTLAWNLFLRKEKEKEHEYSYR